MFATDILTEIYVALVVVICTAAGVFISIRLTKTKSQETELVLTSRESQILSLITQGMSNAEIADKLFLSLSTVKREVSALFVKMDVKNRTQAQEKANRLKINSNTLV